jgi:hypothetical protein
MEEADVGLQAGAAQSTLDHHSCVISDLYRNTRKLLGQPEQPWLSYLLLLLQSKERMSTYIAQGL